MKKKLIAVALGLAALFVLAGCAPAAAAEEAPASASGQFEVLIVLGIVAVIAGAVLTVGVAVATLAGGYSAGEWQSRYTNERRLPLAWLYDLGYKLGSRKHDPKAKAARAARAARNEARFSRGAGA